MQISVNGTVCDVEAADDTPLLYVLRNDLGLNGPEFGCGLGQCGACTVIMNKKATRSCVTPIGSVGDQKVVTLEGIAVDGKMHRLQEAFIAEHAAQCGYCSNGMIITAKALLDAMPNPDEDTIKETLSSNLCRCGVHNRIVRAVRRAAEGL